MLFTLPKRSLSGFSLIEILITVAIVGILAAITIPSYQGSIQISRRAEAKSELLHLAQLEVKWRLNKTSYGSLIEILSNDGDDANNQYDYNKFVSQHPDYSFAVTINADTSDPFTITAVPYYGQANDICGTLSIDINVNISSSNTTECLNP